jgi:hypothetical protein
MSGIIPLIVAVALTAAAPQPPPRAHADAPVLCVKEEDCPQPDSSSPAARPTPWIETPAS